MREELEKRVKNYRWLLIIVLLTLSWVRLFLILDVIPSPKEESFFTGAMDGLLIGFHIGLMIVLSTIIIKLKRALKDEKKMKSYYIFLTDERNILIKTKSGVPLNIINAYIFVVIGYLLQSISMYISIACIIVALYLLVQSIFLKIYYQKIM